MLNDGSHKTFIATYGAEAQGDERTFDAIEPEAGDVVHISGNTLMDHSAAGIEGFLHRAGANPEQRPYTIVLNPTNSLHLVSDHLIEDTVLCRPTWSCNRQEANTLAERLGITRSALTKHVQALESFALVEKEHPKENAKSYTLRVTEKGLHTG